MKSFYYLRITVFFLFAILAFNISGQTFTVSNTINSFPTTLTNLNSSVSNGGVTASGMQGSCNNLPCCSTLVYKVNLPEDGSLRVEFTNFQPLSGSIIAYRSLVPNPTNFSDLEYISGTPGNFCGFRDTLELGRGFYWDGVPYGSLPSPTGITGVYDFNSPSASVGYFPSGDYYLLFFNENQQSNVNVGGQTGLTFEFAPNCPANTVCASQTISRCSSYLSPTGKTYTTSGTYKDTLVGQAAGGLDSLITTELTINGPVVATQMDSSASCNGGADGGAGAGATGGTSPYTYSWSNGATTSSITGVPAGTYSITITDNNACTATASQVITELTPSVSTVVDSNASCNGLSDGGATASATGGTAPYTYLWSNAATTASITGVTAGTYTVTVTDNSGCTNTDNSTVTEPATLVAATVVDSNASCNGLSDGGATASATGGTAPYTYLWSNAATTASITGVTAGTYTVTITDNKGCTDTENSTITEPATLVAATVVDSNASCNGLSDGGATASATGGTAPYTYLWSNAATTASITGVTAGTYTVTITDNKGCTDTENSTITEPATLVAATVVDSNASCNGLSDGGATASATGGTAPYTYLWSNAATTASITGVTAGTYTVTITDNKGCTDTGNSTITESATLVAATVVDSNASCNGLSDGGATASATGGTGPYTYLWSNAATTASITGVTAGTYTVTVTDNSGCTNTDNSTVTEPATLVAATVVDSNASCNGLSDGGATASATGGTAPYTYVWSNAATTASITGVTAGTYTVTITDNKGCTDTENSTITEPAVLAAATIVDANVTNIGGSNGGATASATGGTAPYTYTWSNAATTASITGVTAGTYTVTITDNSACTDTEVATILEPSGAIPDLVISEIMYNPPESGTDSLEYIEILNNGSSAVDIENFYFSQGVTHTFGSRVMNPGEVIVVAVNSTAFNNVFGFAPDFVWTSGGLSNGGEDITLLDDFGRTIDSVDFDDNSPWPVGPPSPDGQGPSIELMNVNSDNNIGSNWQISSTVVTGQIINGNQVYGSPGVVALSVSKTINDVSCNGGNDGSVVLIPSGGLAPYTFNWNSSSNLTSSNPVTIPNLSAGKYYVTITDDNNNTIIDSATVAEPALIQTIQTTTSCDSYLWSQTGLTYSTSGMYYDTLTAVNSCDSIVTLDLTINMSDMDTMAMVVCDTNFFVWNNDTLRSTGFYNDTLQNSIGCDSITTLDLAFGTPMDTTVADSACVSYTWAQTGLTYDSTGLYVDTIATMTGCDSIVTLDLTIFAPSDTTFIVQQSCDNFTWGSANMTYDSTGVYYDTLVNTNGCDSIVELNLTINYSQDTTLNVTACDEYLFTIDGDTLLFTSSTTYIDTINSSTSCDSIITLNLTINNSSNDTIVEYACDNFRWSENNRLYRNSGMYQVSLNNQFGCDSIITLDLTIRDVLNTVVNTGDSIFAIEAGDVQYQWLDCDNDDAPIPGATGRGFKPDTTGNFKVAIISDSNCVDTSSCNPVRIIGLGENSLSNNSFSLYPNPTTHSVTLEFSSEVELGKAVQLMNIKGAVVKEINLINHKQQIDVSDLSEGVYFVRYLTAYKRLVVTQ